jgi:hypothetical protein
MKIKIFILLLPFSTSPLFSQEIQTDIPKAVSDSTVIVSDSIAITPDSTAIVDESIKDEIIDGKWWISVGQMGLKPYMVGLFDGLSLGTSLVVQRFHPNDICYRVGANAADRYLARFDTLVIGHIGDALDEFYADTINLKVHFEHAFNYMVYKFSEHDPEKLEQMLEMYRREDGKR